MTATYTPQPDSIADRVIAFFTANPDAVLDCDKLEAKFNKPRKQFHSFLGLAVEAGILKRQTNDDDEIEYSLGTGRVSIKPTKLPPTAARAEVLLAGGQIGQKTNGKRVVKAPFVCDPLSFTIRDDRPVPVGSGKGRLGTDWTPLLQKLKVGQSVDVPAAAHATLSKQMRESKKAGTGSFMLRKSLINNQIFGLWRVK